MRKEVFIVIILILAIISIVVLFYPKINKKVFKMTFRKRYYKKLYRLALNKDWRLINNFTFRLDEKNNAHFDHILFADKFIYCIVDKYWHGGICGKIQDDSWFFYPDKKSKCFIDNPLNINRVRTEKLSLVTGLDFDMFISVVVVNDDCLLDEYKPLNTNNHIIKISKLKKLITMTESRDVGVINDKQLQQVVYEINNLKI